MKYDGRKPGNGWWNCPFSPAWVERMKRAAKACERLTAEQVESDLDIQEPSLKFLDEEQDKRGLPLSWCREYDARHEGWPVCCTAIYDYDSIPEMVVSNGENDWPIVQHERVLTA